MVTQAQLKKLAKEYGTPLFVVDHDQLRKNLAEFKRFDDGLTNAQIGRQPVGVGLELVVQPDDGVGARLADQELHG